MHSRALSVCSSRSFLWPSDLSYLLGLIKAVYHLSDFNYYFSVIKFPNLFIFSLMSIPDLHLYSQKLTVYFHFVIYT